MKNQQGFTLLELSIVLVIIGLIIGGVTVGGELIKQAELGKVSRDVGSYQTSVNTFKMKYNQLPGDFNNAFAYWPSTTTQCAANATDCNGDGSGAINGLKEQIKAWTHMSLAGVIPGSFNNSTVTVMTPGSNVPSANVTGGGIGIWNSAATATPFGNMFILGSVVATAANTGPVIAAPDAASIDGKMDDGVAGTGRVRSLLGTGGTASSCVTSGAYNLSETAANCAMYFDNIDG